MGKENQRNFEQNTHIHTQNTQTQLVRRYILKHLRQSAVNTATSCER